MIPTDVLMLAVLLTPIMGCSYKGESKDFDSSVIVEKSNKTYSQKKLYELILGEKKDCSNLERHTKKNSFEEIFDKKNAFTKKEFNERFSYYKKEYLPERKLKINIDDIPDFPQNYILNNGKYEETEKYDFLTGALYGWYDMYLGQTATRLFGRDAFVDGYYYGITEAVKISNKKYGLNSDKKDGAENSNK